MNTLKDFVNWKLTHADKTAEASGYPLTMENCKANKKMKQLEVYGNSFQDGTPTPEAPIEVQSVGELVTDITDVNYGKYKVPITVRGINLFCMDKVDTTPKTVNGVTFTPLSGERVHIKGKATQNIAVPFIVKINGSMPTKKGRYKAKPNKFTANGCNVSFGISDGTNTIYVNDEDSYVNVNFDGYIRFVRFQISGDGLTREWDDIIELQLMSGTKDIPFEPYVEPITTSVSLNEPLRKIGDYADYIDFANDKVIRVIKEHIITGTETVLPFNGSNPYNVINIGDVGYVIDDICLCNSFAHQSNFSINREGVNTFRVLNSVVNNAARIIFRLYVDGKILYNENKVRPILKEKYESGNPVVFYYGLSEAQEETIECDLPKLKAKTSIVEVDTSILPSNAYGKYIKK